MHAIIIYDQKIDYNVDKVYMIHTYIYMMLCYVMFYKVGNSGFTRCFQGPVMVDYVL